jgi:hypothetical protein
MSGKEREDTHKRLAHTRLAHTRRMHTRRMHKVYTHKGHTYKNFTHSKYRANHRLKNKIFSSSPLKKVTAVAANKPI